jgi:hypothetical protein
MKTLSQTQDHSIRTLRADEVDAVTGGITGGCIRLSTLTVVTPQPPQPFVDQFASILPSWVHHPL